MSNVKGGRSYLTEYVSLRPIYSKRYETYNYNHDCVESTPSTTFVLPIGRKELATTWWKSCPNQCMAHLPSHNRRRKPCKQYCNALRHHVAYLSKQMITTTTGELTNQMARDRDDGHNFADSLHTQILTQHPNAIKNKQSNLIHILPIETTPSRNDANQAATSVQDHTAIYYNLKIGNDVRHPWMEFHVSIVENYPKLSSVPRNVGAKRKLEFDTDNDTDLFPITKTRQIGDRRVMPYRTGSRQQQLNSPHNDEEVYVINRATHGEVNTCDEYDGWMIPHGDVLLYHSAEFEEGIPISTQQLLIGGYATTTTTRTPKSVSINGIPHVTPGTALATLPRQQVSTRQAGVAPLAARLSSQRQLFRTKEKSPLSKQCERLFLRDEHIVEDINEVYKSNSPTSNNSLHECSIQEYSIDCDNDNDDEMKMNDTQASQASDEEQYGTYLSMPMPESGASSCRNTNFETCLAPTIYMSAEDNDKNGSATTHLRSRVATKTVDLSLQQWKDISTRPQRKTVESTSQFRKTMIEIILLRNQQYDRCEAIPSDTSTLERKLIWLPFLFKNDTILSKDWKFDNAT